LTYDDDNDDDDDDDDDDNDGDDKIMMTMKATKTIKEKRNARYWLDYAWKSFKAFN